ncbi:ribose 1,5-bisphosphokinase [Halomonas beimenensis]|uniref:Ribose 1,5-bisphosphate phosphokinase PhnN n=1 Tax=Halomonas beimenensis TaxID=475662 RepID=A0A291PBS9_9GAMM|nr:ribose 1,5-bisphosphokinase [Halomonas beimenensis]ATJ84363.1 ribose 1,5-bisphosphate phosphokinase PhnN [Halomonas beimenensis]
MGRLVYLMGASGVGKDSLLDAARARHPDWLVAHRYVTRDSGGTENGVALTPHEFAARRRLGLFCLTWQAHGLDYGLGIELEAWLARDQTVLLNGSRRALPAARARFGETLMPVLVTAPEAVIAERLSRRGREDEVQIAARLARHRELAAALPELPRLDNGGALDDALVALGALLEEACRA